MPGDSLDLVEFGIELEKRFDVEWLDTDWIDRSTSVGAIYQWIARAVERPAPGDPTWRRLVSMVAQFMDIPVDDVGWDTQPFLRE